MVPQKRSRPPVGRLPRISNCYEVIMMYDTTISGNCAQPVCEERLADLRRAALNLSARGLRVHPLHGIAVHWHCTCSQPSKCQHPGKHPRLKAWQSKASWRDDTIGEWWDQWPNSNVGVATGHSSGVLVIHIDRFYGEQSIASWEQAHGAFPVTWQSSTGNGRHIWFRYPPLTDRDIGNRVDLVRGVDVRGNGGYVVAPCSQHMNGKVYQWVRGHGPDDIDLADPLEWLVDMISRPRQDSAGRKAPKNRRRTLQGQAAMRWKYATPTTNRWNPGSTIPDHTRNDTIFAQACSLRDYGKRRVYAEAICVAINETYCEPPLTPDEVRKLVESAFCKRCKRRPCRRPELYTDEMPLRLHTWLFARSPNTWQKLTHAEIHAGTGISTRHIRRCVNRLYEEGLLDIQRPIGRPNLYLAIPPLEQFGASEVSACSTSISDKEPKKECNPVRGMAGVRHSHLRSLT